MLKPAERSFLLMVVRNQYVPVGRKFRISCADLPSLVGQISKQLGLDGAVVISAAVDEQSTPIPYKTFAEVPDKGKVQVWPAQMFQSHREPEPEPELDPLQPLLAVPPSGSSSAAQVQSPQGGEDDDKDDVDANADGEAEAVAVAVGDSEGEGAERGLLVFEFGPGSIGIGFTAAREGMPVKINRIVPGSPASRLRGMRLGLELYAVNGMAIADDEPHAGAIAMVKAARWRVAAASTQVPPTRLTFRKPLSALPPAVPFAVEAFTLGGKSWRGSLRSTPSTAAARSNSMIKSVPNTSGAQLLQRRIVAATTRPEGQKETEQQQHVVTVPAVARARARTTDASNDASDQLLH